MSDETPPSNLAAAILMRLPIIGYAARCISEERWGRLALLGGNLVMALILAVIWWGAPVLTLVAEVGVVLAFLIIFAIAGTGKA